MKAPAPKAPSPPKQATARKEPTPAEAAPRKEQEVEPLADEMRRLSREAARKRMLAR